VVTTPGQPVHGRERVDLGGAPGPFADSAVRRAQGRPDGHIRAAQDVLRQDVRDVRQRAVRRAVGAVARPHPCQHGGPAQSQAASVLRSRTRCSRLRVLRTDGVRRHARGDAS